MACYNIIIMSRSNYTATGSKKSAEDNSEMKVIKRNGKMENISFDKILRRLKKIGKNNNIKINYTSLAIRIIDQLYSKIPTTKIDELTAEQCASMVSISPEYDTLALHIIVSNHHKNTNSLFSATMEELYQYRDVHGKHSPLLATNFIEVVRRHAEELDGMCDYSRDYLLSYFGFKTLEKSYLMHINRRIVERPQHMWMRVAVGLHGDDMVNVRRTYELMSQKKFTHATPTLFNAGTPRPQLSSCFLLAMDEDSIGCIFQTISECADISKWSGGIGVACSKIRAKGSSIRGTNGRSNGIVPMLRVFNSTCLYVDQCVLPETYIYTVDGPRQIQHCVAGETQILNLAGEMGTIENVLEHAYDGEMIVVHAGEFMDDLHITPEHPVCIVSSSNARAEGKIGNVEYEWIEAKNLRVGDQIVYRQPSEYGEIDQSVGLDDAFVYGLLLAEGGSMLNTDTYTQISFYKKYDYINYFIKKYLENHCIEYTETEELYPVKEWNKICIRWKKTTDLPLRYIDVYDERGEKRIHPRWFRMPAMYLWEILRGILLSYSIIIIGNELFFDNKSRNLIEGMRYICLRNGILAGGYTLDTNDLANAEENPDFVRNEPTYVIKIPKTPAINEMIKDYVQPSHVDAAAAASVAASTSVSADENGVILATILEIRNTTYNGTLYDLKMRGDEHNYTLHQGLVHNGGGKRNGSFAIYLEPWHADVEDFLEMRKNHGDENLKARDLFYALWVPDLFMQRVKENGTWTLMCPDECPGLCDVYGAEFEELYVRYETEFRGRKTMKARDLWSKILDAQMETGTPYLVYKDAVNRKSNQKNIGTIKSSNLCSEITLFTSNEETAVCNLASIVLPAFVVPATGDTPAYFNYAELHEVAKTVTYNLNRVIDVNFYPNEKTRSSNMRHRPIGIGIQGLADVFMMMNLPFGCDYSKVLNKNIFETIYHAAVESSTEIARVDGPYETFAGSPASQGIFQFDLWNIERTERAERANKAAPSSAPEQESLHTEPRYDWDALRADVMKYGLRNSMLLAPMPTASTSQIMGYNECFEPITSNIYSRRTLAGEFIVANKYLMNDLIALGLWNEEVKNNIIANKGSVQQIVNIPAEIREKYKTVWELSMRTLIDMAADRGQYICQSQSLNLWVETPSYSNLTAMHFYGFERGLKTGIYYLRRRAAHQAQQFTIAPQKAQIKEDEVCEMCSA